MDRGCTDNVEVMSVEPRTHTRERGRTNLSAQVVAVSTVWAERIVLKWS
jgi:hypothetical protein